MIQCVACTLCSCYCLHHWHCFRRPHCHHHHHSQRRLCRLPFKHTEQNVLGSSASTHSHISVFLKRIVRFCTCVCGAMAIRFNAIYFMPMNLMYLSMHLIHFLPIYIYSMGLFLIHYIAWYATCSPPPPQHSHCQWMDHFIGKYTKLSIVHLEWICIQMICRFSPTERNHLQPSSFFFLFFSQLVSRFERTMYWHFIWRSDSHFTVAHVPNIQNRNAIDAVIVGFCLYSIYFTITFLIFHSIRKNILERSESWQCQKPSRLCTIENVASILSLSVLQKRMCHW